jgi:hypothetical protein
MIEGRDRAKSNHAAWPHMLKDMLEYVQSKSRVFPVPQRWNALWEMLPERRRIGNGWDPVPILYVDWVVTLCARAGYWCGTTPD